MPLLVVKHYYLYLQKNRKNFREAGGTLYPGKKVELGGKTIR